VTAAPEILADRRKWLDPSGSGLCIAVHDDQGQVIGAVRTIDAAMGNDLEVLEQLTDWRRANAANFFTQFTPTVERTRRWLNAVILADPTRIMFLVEDENGRRVGQFGLCGITATEAQLDNGIRGEAGGHPRLFYFVELAVIRFCFECLGVQRIFGNMFSNNIMAVLLHKSVGLTVENVQSLCRTESGGEVRFDPVADPGQSNTKVQLLTLSLDRAAFYLRHPWIEQLPV
jgi:hypothetical protein